MVSKHFHNYLLILKNLNVAIFEFSCLKSLTLHQIKLSIGKRTIVFGSDVDAHYLRDKNK